MRALNNTRLSRGLEERLNMYKYFVSFCLFTRDPSSFTSAYFGYVAPRIVHQHYYLYLYPS